MSCGVRYGVRYGGSLRRGARGAASPLYLPRLGAAKLRALLRLVSLARARLRVGVWPAGAGVGTE